MNFLEESVAFAAELRISPESIPVDTERLAAFVMARANGAKEFRKSIEPHVATLAEYNATVKRLLPGILCDPRLEAKQAFEEQQSKLKRGEKCASRDLQDFVEDRKARVRATKNALATLGDGPVAAANAIIEGFAVLCKAVADEVERTERELYSLAGCNGYMPSLLLTAMRYLPYRVRGLGPNLPRAILNGAEKI